MRKLAVVACVLGGCYAGEVAQEDIDATWRGRSRAEIEDRWGKPKQTEAAPDGGSVLVWTWSRRHIELPDADLELNLSPYDLHGHASFKPGSIWTSTTYASARTDASGVIQLVGGASIHWGPPSGLNLRWGTILGMHVGMGMAGDATTPLPSGGLYLGGMLTPTFGLVADMSLVSGIGTGGGVMDFAWGMGAQWWPSARVWLRAGPSMVLAFKPGFADAHLAPGATLGASLAIVRAGTFVLDLRADVTLAPEDVFGCLGIGVNMN
jgi:hypothetical protein